MSKEDIEVLLKWTPEDVPLKKISKINYPEKSFPKKTYGEICTDEDCKQPFFSEAYLYNLLGKEDARTLLALLDKALKQDTHLKCTTKNCDNIVIEVGETCYTCKCQCSTCRYRRRKLAQGVKQ